MEERVFRHDSDLVGWCCDQVPKVPHMGYLQGVVKLHASSKSGVRTPRGGGLVSPALHDLFQLPGHPVGCSKSGQLELKGQLHLMIWNRC